MDDPDVQREVLRRMTDSDIEEMYGSDKSTRERHLAEVDGRGVRGQQFSENPGKSAAFMPRRALEPYYNEDGRSVDEPLSTSWIDNVGFDVTITTRGPTIRIPSAPAQRVVTPSGDLLHPIYGPDGKRDNGGEYAVFAYKLSAKENVRSSPSQVLRINVSSRFKRIVRNADIVTLPMKGVHEVLMSNADNGKPVSLDGGIVVQKYRDGNALVLKGSSKWIFRYVRDARQWLLIRVDFAARRSELQGMQPGEDTLYIQPTWERSDEPVNPLLISMEQVEDPTSNPLDPDVHLYVYPTESDETFNGMKLVPGESHNVTFRAATTLLPRSVDPETNRVKQTRFVKLPSLDFFLADARDLLPRKPSLSPFTLRLDDATVIVTPSLDGGYEIEALVIGPMRVSALQDSVQDASRRI